MGLWEVLLKYILRRLKFYKGADGSEGAKGAKGANVLTTTSKTSVPSVPSVPSEPSAPSHKMKLITGLGNPGPAYQKTRHPASAGSA